MMNLFSRLFHWAGESRTYEDPIMTAPLPYDIEADFKKIRRFVSPGEAPIVHRNASTQTVTIDPSKYKNVGILTTHVETRPRVPNKSPSSKAVRAKRPSSQLSVRLDTGVHHKSIGADYRIELTPEKESQDKA